MKSNSVSRPAGALTRRAGGLLFVALLLGSVGAGGQAVSARSLANGRLGAGSHATLAGQTIRLGVWANPVEFSFYAKLVAPFEAQTGAKIKIEYTDYNTYWTKLPTQLAAGTAADVVLINNNLDLQQQSHIFADLNPYMRTSKLSLSNYLPDPFQLYTYQGGLYAAPVNVTIQLLMYNKELLAKAGVSAPTESWTWNDLVTAAIKLTLDKNGKHPNQPGFDVRNVVQWGFWPSYDSESFWDPIIAQNKGTMIDPRTHKYNFEDPSTVVALQWMHDLAWKYHVMPGATAASHVKADPFISGRAALSMQGSYMVIQYLQQISKFKWDVAPLPHQKTWATNDGGIAMAVNRASSNQQAAWELIRYVISQQAQLYWGSHREGVPILRSAMASFFTAPPASAPTILREMTHVINPSLSDAWAATKNGLKIQDGVNNQIALLLNDKSTAAQTARAIDTLANALLNQ